MQRRLILLTFAGFLAAFATVHTEAQQPQQQPQQQQPQQPQNQPQPPGAPPFVLAQPLPERPTVELEPLLQRVGRASNKRFLVTNRVNPQIYLAGVEPNDVTYPVLLSILRANNLAAVEIEGRVNIVPDAEIRFYPVPQVQNDDSSIAADEWVWRVVTTTNVESAQLVPILRPLLPQAAHLAAYPPNRLVIMDRYANAKRITELVRLLDVPARN